MSTIPKEIQDKIDEKYSLHNWMDNQMWNENKRQKNAAEYGYQLATDGREELEKQVKEREEDFHSSVMDNQELRSEITALQSQCTEKEKECEELKEQYSIMDVRRRNAIKSLEESEKQFEQLQEAYNKLIGS